MRATTPRFAPVLALVAAAALLATASPADAIYIETPLSLHVGQDHAEVGDDVDFHVTPNQNNESAAEPWKGKTVKVGYSYDKNENASGDPDSPTSDAGYTEKDLQTITLDDSAKGSFTWTIPDEVQDRNVNIYLEDDAGERLAFAYLAIGNATPMMHLMASGGLAEGEPEGNLDDSTDTSGKADDANEAPAFGPLALLGVLAVAAVGLLIIQRRK